MVIFKGCWQNCLDYTPLPCMLKCGIVLDNLLPRPLKWMVLFMKSDQIQIQIYFSSKEHYKNIQQMIVSRQNNTTNLSNKENTCIYNQSNNTTMKNQNKCLFFQVRVNDMLLWEYLGLIVVADFHSIHIYFLLFFVDRVAA